MEERQNSSQVNNSGDTIDIDLSVLLRDVLNRFSKLWWLAALLVAALAVGT